MSTALLNHQMIHWARKRADMSTDEALSKIHKNYLLWERGEAKPTFKQAQVLAKKLHVPFGYFYLSKPPADVVLAPDLRTVKDFEHESYSPELRDVISDAIRKQDWYRDYLMDNGHEELPFVGKYNKNTAPRTIALDIEKVLHLSSKERENIGKDSFLKVLTEEAENVGICVMRNGKVGSNTHRTLSVGEFRGFALPDSIAPIIFINAADAAAAQIFTLAHELAHLWIGEKGVSNYDLLSNGGYSETERLCNEVAAELLVPAADMQQKWISWDTVEDNAEELVKYFKVSTLVIARRALDLELIERKDFFDFYKVLQKRWDHQKAKRKPGGSFHNTFPIANSKSITHSVINAVYSQKVLMREGARLLGVRPSALDNYAKQRGIS